MVASIQAMVQYFILRGEFNPKNYRFLKKNLLRGIGEKYVLISKITY
jgi:hypothetical protein